MNDAHIHLLVNHVPILFPIAGVIVLIAGFVFRSEAVKRTAFMLFMFGAIASISSMVSGEGAEEAIEKLNGIQENMIEEHEEKAEVFAILSYILGLISALGLWASLKQKSMANILSIVVLLYAFVVIFFGSQTGTSGGEIRHSEIRSDTPQPANVDKEHHD